MFDSRTVFRNLALKTYIVSGFAILILLLGFVASSGYNGLHTITIGVQSADDMNRLVRSIDEVRQKEKDVLIASTPSNIAMALTMIQKIQAQAQQLQSQPTIKNYHVHIIRVIQKVGEYKTIFECYVRLEHDKNAAVVEMQHNADAAIDLVNAIREAQQRKLEEIRKANAFFITDKFNTVNEGNQLVKEVSAAERLRIELSYRYDETKFAQWKSLTQQIFERIESLRERFAVDTHFEAQKSFQQTDNILKSYQQYTDKCSLYLITKNDSDLQEMIRASETALRQMEVIRTGQKEQMETALIETEIRTKQRLSTAENANAMILEFLTARQDEKEFILSGDWQYVENVKTHIHNMLTIAAEIRKRMALDKTPEQIDNAVAAVQAYSTSFLSYIDLARQQETARILMLGASQTAQYACNDARDAQKIDMEAQITRTRNTIRNVAGIAAVLGICTALLITRSITRPVKTLVNAAHAIAAGDFNQEIRVRQRNEIGILARAFQDMSAIIGQVLREMDTLIQAVQQGKLDTRGNVEAFQGDWRKLIVGVNNVIDAFVTPIQATAACLDRISKGDIPQKITQTFQGDFNQIKHHLNVLIEVTQTITDLSEKLAAGDLSVEVTPRSAQDNLMRALHDMVQRLNEIVATVKIAANTVAQSSQEIRNSSENLSEGSSEQAASAQEVSSSMEQMAATIQENAENALQTQKIALRSAEDASDGGKAVAEAVTAMKQIAKSISVVEHIAKQTHMLALNASIEAAKAHDEGRGFAVVASEVRLLARRSREAARQINQLAHSSVEIADKAGLMLATLLPNIEKTANLVQEISQSSHAQSQSAAVISNAIQHLDEGIQRNANAAEKMAAMAEELAVQSELLQHTVAFFKVRDVNDVQRISRGDAGIG